MDSLSHSSCIPELQFPGTSTAVPPSEGAGPAIVSATGGRTPPSRSKVSSPHAGSGGGPPMMALSSTSITRDELSDEQSTIESDYSIFLREDDGNGSKDEQVESALAASL